MCGVNGGSGRGERWRRDASGRRRCAASTAAVGGWLGRVEHARAWHGEACSVPVPRRGACVPARCGRAGGVGSARGGELPSSARGEERGAALERAEQEARERRGARPSGAEWAGSREGWRGRAARQRSREGERKRKEEKEKGKWEREKEKEGRERKKREGERFTPDPRRAVGHAQRRSRVRGRVRARPGACAGQGRTG